jgi:hypothetical protein
MPFNYLFWIKIRIFNKKIFAMMRLLLGFLFLSFQLSAQVLYTDYKPQYEEWNERYILDKIEYTATRTIFHFRYLASQLRKSEMSFHGPLAIDHWTLENVNNPSEIYPLIELKNIKKTGMLLYNSHRGGKLNFRTEPYDVYTCEIHFPKIPKHLRVVNFLEGINKKAYSNHFHCFKVKVKPLDDPELGTVADMNARIKKFEIREFGFLRSNIPAVVQNQLNNSKTNQPTPTETPSKPKVILVEDKEAKAQAGEENLLQEN